MTKSESIAALGQIQDYRFGSMVKSDHFAFARGLTINPTHLPDALEAMRKDNWHLLAIFGETTAKEIGFIFERKTDDRVAMSLGLTNALERNEILRRRIDDLLCANNGLVEQRRALARKFDALAAHVRLMQDMVARYLQPELYRARDGIVAEHEMGRETAFMDDIIYMLDGPEQREVLPNEEQNVV